MKRFLILLLIIALFACGCTREKLPESMEEAADNSGNRAVIYFDKTAFPISLTQDGEQKIENGAHWFYELGDCPLESEFYLYNADSLELSGKSKGYEISETPCFAVNGEWPLFLNPVHTEYSLKNQSNVDEKIAKQAKRLLSANGLAPEEAVVTDIWSCDLDGNGEQEVLFKACNCGDIEAKNYYCFFAFGGEQESQGLLTLKGDDKECAPQKLRPLVIDPEGDGKWSLMLYMENEYRSFIAYSFNGGNFAESYKIIF